MLVVLEKNLASGDKNRILNFLKEHQYKVREQILGDEVILSAAGKGDIDVRELSLLPGVERVSSTTKPYELASREGHEEDSIISVGPVKIGGARIVVMAGPCAVESREQIFETAQRVRESGAVLLRGGAFKPRSSPYSFQGLGIEGLEYMKAAGEKYGMPITSEIVSPENAEAMKDLTDIFQIGARNMQNFELLKKVGALRKPVLLKRGPSATIEEWLLSAEYLMASGTKDVILCERGIRTFETYTRNTLDISAIPVIKKLSHLPILVDPSHALGIRSMISQAALAAIAAGADGLTIEVHPHPEKALSDGPQSLYPEQFEKLMRDVEALAPVVGKELLRTPRPNGRGTHVAAFIGENPLAGSAKATVPRIVFSGESGAFAEQALIRAFGEDAERKGLSSFSAVFDAVLDGSASWGVVPVENSLAGSIHENYDLFIRYPDISIVGELKLRISHCLIGTGDSDISLIKTVRSHPQGFAQCQDFLASHGDWILEPCNNTAGAVVSIQEEKDKTIAAIASDIAARIHGLKVLKEGIETNPLNYTRFLVIARDRDDGLVNVPSGLGDGSSDKASLVFSTPNEPGSLFACLKILGDKGINLSKLESRPIPGKPWRYLFYADVNVLEDKKAFEKAVDELKKKTEDFRILGIYRASL